MREGESNMKIEQILPVILIIIQGAAAVPYLVKGNIGQAVYWAAAAVLNIAVTFLMKE